MNTKRTITEIEIALAHSCSFDFRRNIVVFNVNGWSGKLPDIGCILLLCGR